MSSGPPAEAFTSSGSVLGSAAPGRRERKAPEGHCATAASTSSADAWSRSTQGRRSASNTFGSARMQLCEW
jgi:hypothetical protein